MSEVAAGEVVSPVPNNNSAGEQIEQSRTVLITNLPFTVRSRNAIANALSAKLHRLGRIESIRSFPRSIKLRGMAWVEFSRTASAIAAEKAISGSHILGRTVRAFMSAPPDPSRPAPVRAPVARSTVPAALHATTIDTSGTPSSRIVVRNLPAAPPIDEIQAALRAALGASPGFGRVLVPPNKALAMVLFDTPANAAAALAAPTLPSLLIGGAAVSFSFAPTVSL